MTYFRIPNDETARKKWIEVISQHQKFDNNCPNITVCERHFQATDFRLWRGRWTLKNHVVPSIFDEPKHLSSRLGIDTQPSSQKEHNEKDEKRGKIKRYCKIKYCPNEIGTMDRDVLFFR